MSEKNRHGLNRVALLDIDRTLCPAAVTLDYMRHQIAVGLIRDTESLTRAIDQMLQGLLSGNYINPLTELLRVHAQAQTGLPESEVEAHAEEFFRSYSDWFAYVKPLFELLTKHEYAVHLISAGPHVSVDAIARLFGARGTFPTVYSVKKSENDGSNVFSGEILWNLASPGRRAQTAVAAIGMHAYAGSMMMADSVADAAALLEVQNPFCANPSPELEAIARQQEPEWPIISSTELSKPHVPAIIKNRLGGRALVRCATS